MYKRKLIIFLIFIGISTILISCAYRQNKIRTPGENFENLHVTEELDYPSSALNQPIAETRENNTHYVNILNNGDDALLSITHLIRSAKKSILIQTFIWSADDSGRFVIDELIKAAKRGVKIKIIIDYFESSRKPQIIAYLSTIHSDIEVKLYNPVCNNIVPSKLSVISKMLLDFRNFNQRMHNKVLIVDDRMAISGGRNYQNDYFDRSITRNFKDRGVLVIGKIVKEMTDSFMRYWAYPLSVPSRDMKDIHSLVEKGDSGKVLAPEAKGSDDLFDELKKCEASNGCLSKRLIDKSYTVENIEFIADEPGKNSRIGKYKTSHTTNRLYTLLEEAKSSITMQTPYLIISSKGTGFFKKLVKDKPDVEFLVSSNSLASADHIHAYAFSYKNKKKYLKNFRWQIFESKPIPQDNDKMISPINKEKRSKDYFTCIHAKSYVIDRKKVWIGSFNLDPRSANLNTEAAIIIDNEQVAKDVDDDIRRDIGKGNSWTIGKRKQLPVVSHFSGLISGVMEMVPVVDIWPFTYSGSYELKADKEALPFFDKDFYDHYDYVGPFPKVELSEKEIKARLIKSFFGPVESLI
jgi:cardiolipin synthase C